MKNALERIIIVNKKEPKTPMEVMVKVQEEVGELAAEILRYHGKKGANGDTKKKVRFKILEEACDVIITSVSIIEKFGYTEKDISKMIKKKCNKWKSNLSKYKVWEKIK
jgi:NTP pyrophosphatase (non-canonical NTP hydrolase)